MLKEAVKCFYQAASGGNVRAQYNLALCLHQGRGVERNLPEAVCKFVLPNIILLLFIST